MKKELKWFIICMKLQLKNRILQVFLLVFPVLIFFTVQLAKIDQNNLRVALYQGENKISNRIVKLLLEGESIFSFYEVESESKLKQDVLSGKADSGFVFKEDFDSKYKAGNLLNSIQFVASTTSRQSKVARETVYTAVYRVYGEKIDKDTLNRELIDKNKLSEAQELLRKQEDYYLAGDVVFSFDLRKENGGYTEIFNANKVNTGVGVCAVLLFLYVLVSSGSVYLGKKAVYEKLSQKERNSFQKMYIFSSSFILASMSIMVIKISNNSISTIRIITAVFLYLSLLLGWNYFLVRLWKSEMGFYSSIPIILILSIFISPVFIKMDVYILPIKILKWFIPTTYLMEGMNHNLSLIIMGTVSIFMYALEKIQMRRS